MSRGILKMATIVFDSNGDCKVESSFEKTWNFDMNYVDDVVIPKLIDLYFDMEKPDKKLKSKKAVALLEEATRIYNDCYRGKDIIMPQCYRRMVRRKCRRIERMREN